jgi:osmoprotectant transport system substrate-binding protein
MARPGWLQCRAPVRPWLLAAACLAMLMSGCASETQGSKPAITLLDSAITVGSFDFPESELLAEIYSIALEHHGFEVRRMARLGPRELVQPALAAGLLEFVPEYSGTALQFISLGESEPAPDAGATHEALVKALAGGPLVALAPSPAQDRNAFVVTRETADRYGLTAITDLMEVAPRLTFGGPPECPTRPLCLLGLEDVYGLRFGGFIALDAGGPLTHHALQNGYIDVALLFTTDPLLIGGDLVELTDNRRLQPAENVTPIVRNEVLERVGPDFEVFVNRVSRQITTARLRQLNARVAAGRDVSEVAREWISSHDLTP